MLSVRESKTDLIKRSYIGPRWVLKADLSKLKRPLDLGAKGLVPCADCSVNNRRSINDSLQDPSGCRSAPKDL